MNPDSTISAAATPSGGVGVFDSGVGGLSVLREIRALLPNETLFYVADSAHVPYGEKPASFIAARATAITEFLLRQGAKAVVVACNTASSAALATLRARFTIPIIGMEPAVKPAAQQTRSRVVAVLATPRTLSGDKFANLLTRFGAGVVVHVQPCPGWVEQVETGNIDEESARLLVEKHVAPLLTQGVDTLVLACTHYPFLRPLIQQIAGPSITIIDPSAAVARELQRRLQSSGLLATATEPGRAKFWTSGRPERVKPAMVRLWGNEIELELMTTAGDQQ